MINRIMDVVYPPTCLACAAEGLVETGICQECWTDSYLLTGAICDRCGSPVPIGDDNSGTLVCDRCIAHPPVWDRGRASFAYQGAARRLAMALKHGDRQEVAQFMGRWMSQAGQSILADADIIAPVPLHWSRMLKRKFNQSALLAKFLGVGEHQMIVPDLLKRDRRTVYQKNMNREERYENQRGAISINPNRADLVRGKSILIIDDVLTTGATLTASTEALLHFEPEKVNVLVFARVASAV